MIWMELMNIFLEIKSLPRTIGIGGQKFGKPPEQSRKSKKNTTEEARWVGVKFGLEIAAGMHDSDF
jgi:hypothetical protein